MRTILMIGGTGTISMSITRRLAADGGWKVCLLNRGNRADDLPPGVEVIACDINDAGKARSLLANRRFDAVADFIAYTPDAVRRDIDLFRGRTGQYVFISTASVYKKPVEDFPITESTPLKNPYWQYSRDKIACEDLLTREYRDADFPMTIVRPSQTYDYRSVPVAMRYANSWQTLARLRDGKRIVIHGDGTSLWTVTHADDFAVGFCGLLGHPGAIGQAFHITSDDVLTWNGIYGLLAKALGVEMKAVHVASEELARMNPDFTGGLLGDKAYCAVFDTGKLRRLTPQFSPRIRFADAVHVIVKNMVDNPALQIPDPKFDAFCEEVLAKWG